MKWKPEKLWDSNEHCDMNLVEYCTKDVIII